MSKILVTGSAGFIGYHLVNRLLADGHDVTGLDIINSYYDVNLKYARLRLKPVSTGRMQNHPGEGLLKAALKIVPFIRLDLEKGSDV
jgi:UDP-glucuronate 4-epimerase